MKTNPLIMLMIKAKKLTARKKKCVGQPLNRRSVLSLGR